jgi:uncharacterized protein YjbI with pentapeptide repeats
MTHVADDRCGYTFEASTVADLGGVCCWRPVWGDAGRCIWHADVSQKPTLELESAAPGIGDRLDGAIFRDVDLAGSDWLSGRTLTDTRFENANLEETDLSGSDLRYSHFEGVDAKRTNFRGSNLEHAEFDRTDLRGADLCAARLHYAVFDNARIAEETNFGKNVVYESELLDEDAPGRSTPRLAFRSYARDPEHTRLERYEAAHWTYNELQRLAEDNGLTGASRHYYHKRKNVRRREAWEFGSSTRALAQEAWRWTTGYGANPWRVIATAAFVIVLCSVLYPLLGGIQETIEQTGVTLVYSVENPDASQWKYLLNVFGKSLYFSVVTFATLGYGDMQPVINSARAVAAAEALLGQLLMALLVFVLTRNVTWSE